MLNIAEDYRSEAERAKRIADRVSSPDLKRQWLAVEEGYSRLARSAEAQAKAGGDPDPGSADLDRPRRSRRR